MEVTPTAHHVMGGLRIDSSCGTNLQGLFAAGEVAGGVHGGNRLGGNALAAGQVFGKIAGDSASKYAATAPTPVLNRKIIQEEYSRVMTPLEREEDVIPSKETERLQRTMWEKAGLFRNEQDLNAALKFIKHQQEQIASKLSVRNKTTRYNTEWISALELQDMTLVAEMIVRAALLRKESRGAHYRTDYPNPDNKRWFANIIISQSKGLMALKKTQIIVTKWQPPWVTN